MDNIKEAKKYFNTGLEHYRKSEYDKAITDFTVAIKRNPKDVELYHFRGIAYSDNGDYNNAINDYNKAIDLKPNYASAYYNRGNAYDDKGEYDKAINDYTKAIKIKPDYADAYYNRGSSYDDKGEYDKAINDYNKAIELKPDYAPAYCNTGYTLVAQGKYKEAIKCYDKAIELDPEMSDAYINKGKALVILGKEKEARECWAKVPRNHHEYSTAQIFMGIYHEDSLIKSKFAEMDKTCQDIKNLYNKTKEVSNKVSESYKDMVDKLVFKDFKGKAKKLEEERKGYAESFKWMIFIDIFSVLICFTLTALILITKESHGWEFLGQSLLITSPTLIVLLWATKYFNRRAHELVHLKEEYEYKFLSLLVFDRYKDTIQKYGDPMISEYVTKIINTITENPTLCLYHKKADTIPKRETIVK